MKKMCLALIIIFVTLSFSSCNDEFKNLRIRNDNADVAIGYSLIKYCDHKASLLISMWHFFYYGERFDYYPDNHDEYINNLYREINIAISDGKKTERDTVISDGYIFVSDSNVFYLFYDENYDDTLIFDGECLYICNSERIINAINEDSSLRRYYESPSLRIEDYNKGEFYYNRYFLNRNANDLPSYFKEFDVVNNSNINKTREQVEEIAFGLYPDVFSSILFVLKDPISGMWSISLGRSNTIHDGCITVYILPDGQIKALDYTFSSDLFEYDKI